MPSNTVAVSHFVYAAVVGQIPFGNNVRAFETVTCVIVDRKCRQPQPNTADESETYAILIWRSKYRCGYTCDVWVLQVDVNKKYIEGRRSRSVGRACSMNRTRYELLADLRLRSVNRSEPDRHDSIKRTLRRGTNWTLLRNRVALNTRREMQLGDYTEIRVCASVRLAPTCHSDEKYIYSRERSERCKVR